MNFVLMLPQIALQYFKNFCNKVYWKRNLLPLVSVPPIKKGGVTKKKRKLQCKNWNDIWKQPNSNVDALVLWHENPWKFTWVMIFGSWCTVLWHFIMQNGRKLSILNQFVSQSCTYTVNRYEKKWLAIKLNVMEEIFWGWNSVH